LALLTILLSIVHFHPWEWDATAYHLPFTARFWRLPQVAGITPLLPERYAGFPVLWRIALLPGLVLAMPRLHAAVNLIALAVLCLAAARVLRMPWPLTVACCLCFPIALFGFRSTYQDFFVNAMITAAALLLFQERSPPRPGDRPADCSADRPAALALLAIAANIKTQGLLMAVVILAVAIATRLGRRTPVAARPASRWLAAALLALIFLQPGLNLLRYGNPFYPIATLGFAGPNRQYSTPIEYLPKLPLLTDLVSFQLSASEIDPLLMGQAASPSFRSMDMASKRAVRSGGSNGLLYVALLLLAVVSVFVRLRREGFPAAPQTMLSLRLLLSALLVACLPQSLELRYFLFALFAPALVAVTSPFPRLRAAARLAVALGLVYSLIVVFGAPGGWFRPAAIRANLMDQLPSRQACLAMGTLQGGENGTPRRLVLDPALVANNLPFQCRLVLEPEVFIDYRPRR
jgi:hypothetical protein